MYIIKLRHIFRVSFIILKECTSSKKNGLIALCPYLFINCVILYLLFFFSDFISHLLSPFLSFNDDFEQNTTIKDEVQNR